VHLFLFYFIIFYFILKKDLAMQPRPQPPASCLSLWNAQTPSTHHLALLCSERKNIEALRPLLQQMIYFSRKSPQRKGQHPVFITKGKRDGAI
jgi:hypothetical protein